METKNNIHQNAKIDLRNIALFWWKSLTFNQQSKEVADTLGCDNGLISILTDSDIEILYSFKNFDSPSK